MRTTSQSLDPDISDDGRRVAFQSWATDLLPNDTNTTSDVFVRDLAEGTTMRASEDVFGHEAFILSASGQLSGDGTVVAFLGAVPFSPGSVYARLTLEPVVTGVTPSSVPRGGVTMLTITGSGFPPDAKVHVTLAGVNVDAVTVVDEHQIQVALGVEADAPLGTGDIWIGAPAPGVGSFGMTGSVTVAEDALTVTIG
jgi:hypothetical protein